MEVQHVVSFSMKYCHEFNSCAAGPAFANSVDPDQLASPEANWSASALFFIQYMNLY